MNEEFLSENLRIASDFDSAIDSKVVSALDGMENRTPLRETAGDNRLGLFAELLLWTTRWHALEFSAATGFLFSSERAVAGREQRPEGGSAPNSRSLPWRGGCRD